MLRTFRKVAMHYMYLGNEVMRTTVFVKSSMKSHQRKDQKDVWGCVCFLRISAPSSLMTQEREQQCCDQRKATTRNTAVVGQPWSRGHCGEETWSTGHRDESSGTPVLFGSMVPQAGRWSDRLRNKWAWAADIWTAVNSWIQTHFVIGCEHVVSVSKGNKGNCCI